MLITFTDYRGRKYPPTEVTLPTESDLVPDKHIRNPNDKKSRQKSKQAKRERKFEREWN